MRSAGNAMHFAGNSLGKSPTKLETHEHEEHDEDLHPIFQNFSKRSRNPQKLHQTICHGLYIKDQ